MADTGSTAYDGFLSYSHAADDLLAPRLQAGLQRFAKPWWKRRALRIFRDEASLSANPHLWSSITDALDDSDWFVLLLSPDAAQSEWVNREIDYWVEHKDAARILPVVTDGTFGWDGDVAGNAVPASLRGVFGDEPRWVDLRFARTEAQLNLRHTRFRDAVADVAAAVRGVAKDELESEEIRQHRRTIRTAWTGGIAILALGIAATFGAVVAFNAQQDAQDERDKALAAEQTATEERDRAVAAEAEAETERDNAETARRDALALALSNASIVDLEVDQERALLLAVEAVEVTRRADGTVIRAAEEALHRTLQSFRLVQTFDGGSDMVVAPDGAAAVAGERATIWNTQTGEILATSPAAYTATDEDGDPYQQALEGVTALDVNPDGDQVAMGTADGTVALWDPVSDEVIPIQEPGEGQGRQIRDVRFSPDGSLVVWGDEGGFWTAWDLAAGAASNGGRVDVGVADLDVRVAFSPDGSKAAIAGDASGFWDLSGEIIELSPGSTISDLAFRDGSTLLSVDRDGRLAWWAVEAGLQEETSFDLGDVSPTAVAIDSTGSLTAVGFANGQIRLLSGEGADLTELFSLSGHQQAVRSLSFTAESGLLLSTSEDATRIWDVGSNAEREWFTLLGAAPLGADLAFSPDGSLLAVAHDEAVIGLYDSFTGEEVDSIQASTLYFGFAASLDFLPDGSSLVASFIDPRLYPVGFMRTFDTASFEEEHKLPGLWQVGMDVDPDGAQAVSAGPGGVTIFDLATGDAVDAVLGTGEGQGRVVAFSPDGSLLAFQDTSGHVDVFDFATRTQLASFDHPMPAELGLGSIEFSPDGNLLLTAGADGTVRLWEPETGTEIASLSGHQGPVNAAHFSADGQMIATGGSDGTVRLWETAGGTELLMLQEAGSSVGSIAFSGDGRLAVLGADRTVQMYALNLDDLLDLADQRLTRSLTDEECLTFLQQETCPEGD